MYVIVKSALLSFLCCRFMLFSILIRTGFIHEKEYSVARGNCLLYGKDGIESGSGLVSLNGIVKAIICLFECQNYYYFVVNLILIIVVSHNLIVTVIANNLTNVQMNSYLSPLPNQISSLY